MSGSTVMTVSAAVLQSIALTPANPSVPKGQTQQFTATGTYSDNSTQNITNQVTWASATKSVATIISTGLAQSLATGTTNITAALGSVTSPTDTLTVTAEALTSIAVAPASPSVAKGLAQQFTATGTYTDGSTANLTNQVTWASATPSVATFSSTGLATGVAQGTSVITATLGTVASPGDTLTVTAAALTSIAVTPASPSVAKGLAQQFTATGTYTDGSTADLTTQVTWASATPAVGTINSSGLATGVAQGTSVITATLGTVASPGDTLTVTVPRVASVALVPSVASPTYGQALTFTATVSPASAGGPTPGGTVQFRVDGMNLGPAVTLVKGAATSIATSTLGAGNQTVTALYSGDNTYAGNSQNRGLTVAKAHLTVSAVTKSKVYGAAVPTLTATFSGFVNGDTAKVVSGAAKLTTTATTKSSVGAYTITIAAGTLSAANYDFPKLVNGTLTVTKAQLTVTAVNKSKKQGAANPALTYTITGFVNGDKSTVVHGKPTLSTTATKTSKAGSYPIIVALGTLSASNYHFTLVNGTLTVTGAKAAGAVPDSEVSPSPFDRLIPTWWRKGHGLSRNS